METANFEVIKLPPHSTGGLPFFDVISKRSTNRNFKSDKYKSLQQVSDCLWCAYGENRPITGHGHKTVASACNICPFTVYVFLKDGIFIYDSLKNELQPFKKGDFREKSGGNEFCKFCNMNIVFMQKKDAECPYKGITLDQNTRNRYADLDGGHCTQMVYLYAATQGLCCCERAYADEKVLKEVLNLGDDYRFTIAISIGY